MTTWQTDGSCCNWSGMADYAAVPCPNPHCPAPTVAQTGVYYDAHIRPLEYPDMPAEHAADRRAKYIRDVQANPEAMRQLAEALRAEETS